MWKFSLIFIIIIITMSVITIIVKLSVSSVMTPVFRVMVFLKEKSQLKQKNSQEKW